MTGTDLNVHLVAPVSLLSRVPLVCYAVVRLQPALFMNASATITDLLLRRAFGQQARPSDPHRTVGDWRHSFWRLSLSDEQRDRHRRRRRSQFPELRVLVSRRSSAISRRTVMNNAG